MTIVLNLNNFNQTSFIFKLPEVTYYYQEKNKSIPDFIQDFIKRTENFEKYFVIYDSIELYDYFKKVITPWIFKNFDKIADFLSGIKKEDLRNFEKVVKKDKKLKEIFDNIFYLAEEAMNEKNSYYDFVFLISIIYLIQYYLIKKDFEKIEKLVVKGMARIVRRNVIKELPKESFLSKA